MRGTAVITGAGIISPLGDSPAVVHRAMCEGRRGIRPATALGGGADEAAGAAIKRQRLRRRGQATIRGLNDGAKTLRAFRIAQLPGNLMQPCFLQRNGDRQFVLLQFEERALRFLEVTAQEQKDRLAGVDGA